MPKLIHHFWRTSWNWQCLFIFCKHFVSLKHVDRFLRLRRNTHWQWTTSFDSLLSRLGHHGKGWSVRGTTTRRLLVWDDGLFNPSWNSLKLQPSQSIFTLYKKQNCQAMHAFVTSYASHACTRLVCLEAAWKIAWKGLERKGFPGPADKGVSQDLSRAKRVDLEWR